MPISATKRAKLKTPPITLEPTHKHAHNLDDRTEENTCLEDHKRSKVPMAGVDGGVGCLDLRVKTCDTANH